MKPTPYESYLQRSRIQVAESYLTAREYQVICMYMDGMVISAMGSKLACSHKTIYSHIRVAKERLGARTIHELVAMVARADALRERGRSSTRDNLVVDAGVGRAAELRRCP